MKVTPYQTARGALRFLFREPGPANLIGKEFQFYTLWR